MANGSRLVSRPVSDDWIFGLRVWVLGFRVWVLVFGLTKGYIEINVQGRVEEKWRIKGKGN